MSILKCPVCNQELELINKTYKCNKNHSYDLSRNGYVNLMLANQGHHLDEGDSMDMIDARRRFLTTGKYDCLRNKITELIKEYTKNGYYTQFADLACGEGYYTNYIHQSCNLNNNFFTYGLDISKSAIHRCSAAKNILHLTNIQYVIGNLDYLPFMDNSLDIMLNCFAPINELEFVRVLKKNGYYIRVLPGTYHLLELKEFLYPNVRLNKPKDDEFTGMKLINTLEIKDKIHLNNQEIQDLFTMTPYYYKTKYEDKERLKTLESLDTQIEFVIKIYQK